jgi:hypothetical protein
MEYEVAINNYTLTTLESIFNAMRGRSYEEIFDASVYLYCFVSREGIYPPKIIEGFYSAMAIIANLTFGQFLQVRQALN